METSTPGLRVDKTHQKLSPPRSAVSTEFRNLEMEVVVPDGASASIEFETCAFYRVSEEGRETPRSPKGRVSAERDERAFNVWSDSQNHAGAERQNEQGKRAF